MDWRELELKKIKTVAWQARDPDDFFTSVENLHDKLSSLPPEKIQFENEGDIALAVLMMADGILPIQAHLALANTFIEALEEITKKKYTVNSLGIKPPTRGRKSNANRDDHIITSVAKLKQSGICADDAYLKIANEHHVSKDTIRRIYERANKNRRNRGLKGLP